MVSRRVVRRRRQVLAGAVVATALAVTVAAVRDDGTQDPVAPATAAADGSSAAAPVGTTPTPTTPAPTTPTTAPEPEPDPDRLAGVLDAEVPAAGTGSLLTVPGTSDAGPSAGPDLEVLRTRVQVEGGLPADAGAVAATVMEVLQDPRGWAGDGYAFARTDDAEGSPGPDLTVVLASPDLTDELCAPLRTQGVLSCRNGDLAVLNWYRWVEGASSYGEDRVAYRQYLVAHEVGHVLGRGHVGCPGEGERAPVMLQQTRGLQGCAANPWPHR